MVYLCIEKKPRWPIAMHWFALWVLEKEVRPIWETNFFELLLIWVFSRGEFPSLTSNWCDYLVHYSLLLLIGKQLN